MFRGALSFKQDLCVWNDVAPATGSDFERMFQDTQCDSEDDPIPPGGNFCAICMP